MSVESSQRSTIFGLIKRDDIGTTVDKVIMHKKFIKMIREIKIGRRLILPEVRVG